MVALDILTFNCLSYFSYNVLCEVDSILWFMQFASRCPSLLLLLSRCPCDEEDDLSCRLFDEFE